MTFVTSDQTDQVFAAFVAAQSEFLHVKKEGTVPLTKSGLSGPTASFATFPDVIEHIKPILNKHGLAFIQTGTDAVGGVRVCTVIIHGASGQFFRGGGTFIPAAKTDPMGYGSAESFAKRYDVLKTCGVATDDDDGKAAFEGFEREAQRRATEAAAAANRIDERQLAILFTLGKTLKPATSDERLIARYKDLVREDYADTLKAGVKALVDANKVDPATGEDIEAAAMGTGTVEEIKQLMGASS